MLPDAYRVATDGVHIGPEVGSCGAAAYLRKPVFVADVMTHPYVNLVRDLPGNPDYAPYGHPPLFLTTARC